MSTDLLEKGYSKNPLGKDSFANGDKLAEWILREIPSSKRIPFKYTEGLLKVFRRHSVPFKICQAAFFQLQLRGVYFDWPPVNSLGMYGDMHVVGPPPAAPPRIGVGPHNAGDISKNAKAQSYRHALAEYEHQYVLAIKTNDEAGAIAIFVKALGLVWELAKAHGEALQVAANEPMVEWKEFDRAVEEAMDRARMLRTHIRYMSRDELRSLRNAPTPEVMRNISFRIAQGVVRTRAVPSSARRARK
jgi:hypothetical protein